MKKETVFINVETLTEEELAALGEEDDHDEQTEE